MMLSQKDGRKTSNGYVQIHEDLVERNDPSRLCLQKWCSTIAMAVKLSIAYADFTDYVPIITRRGRANTRVTSRQFRHG